jgi:hypothetical protein
MALEEQRRLDFETKHLEQIKKQKNRLQHVIADNKSKHIPDGPEGVDPSYWRALPLSERIGLTSQHGWDKALFFSNKHSSKSKSKQKHKYRPHQKRLADKPHYSEASSSSSSSSSESESSSSDPDSDSSSDGRRKKSKRSNRKHKKKSKKSSKHKKSSKKENRKDGDELCFSE